MKNRILLPLLLALAGLVLWLVNAGEGREPEFGALEGETAPVARATEPDAELPALARSEREAAREEVATEPLLEPMEPGGEHEFEGVRADGSVLVEVHFAVPEGLPLGIPTGAPHPFAGTIVHTQLWEEATFETTPLQVAADEEGVARFLFPGAVHLDWFRAEFPARFQAFTGFVELHLELTAGTLYRISLVVEESVQATGRVVDLNGVALSGVEVSAYYEADGVRDSGEELDPWYPGHYTTTSGAGGWFTFEHLPSGESFIGVAPGEWLQIQPDYDGNYGDGCSYELEVGDPRDIGTLMVARREVVALTVLDSSGSPVPLATVEFHPLRFGATPMLTEEQWEERFEPDIDDEEAFERIAKEGEAVPRWPFSVQELIVDEEGKGEFVAVAGTWRVEARPRLGKHEDTAIVPLELPARELIVRLPGTLTTLRGTVVSSVDLKPVEGVRVTITRRGRNFTKKSDSVGRFAFPGIARDGDYELSTTHRSHFPARLSVGGNAPDLVLELQPSGSVLSRIEDKDGKRVQRQTVQLVRRAGGAPVDASAVDWLSRMGEPIYHTRTSSSGSFSFLHLYPGDYEVALVLPVATGATGKFGEAIVEERVWQSWTLPATGTSDALVTDLGSYQPAKLVQYTHVAGQVSALDTGSALPGARIEVIRQERSYFVTTDADGHYEFLLPAGKAKLSISHPGYKTTEPRESNFGRGRYSQTTILLPLGG